MLECTDSTMAPPTDEVTDVPVDRGQKQWLLSSVRVLSTLNLLCC